MLPQLILGLTRRRGRGARQASCSTRSASASAAITGRRSSPAASSSAWPSPAPSPTGRRLLLADEPTGNLDPPTAERVFEQLLSLVRAVGRGGADRHPQSRACRPHGPHLAPQGRPPGRGAGGGGDSRPGLALCCERLDATCSSWLEQNKNIIRPGQKPDRTWISGLPGDGRIREADGARESKRETDA